MTGMGAHNRLTRKQRQALGFAVLVVVAGMAMGFWSSFLTLYDAAQRQGWAYPARLPLSVDSGIVAYVILDHLAVTLGSRSRWLHMVALSLAAFTVWANAALGLGTGVWRVVDAAMPAVWVLGVEALRFLWKRLHEDPASKGARIPAARWAAAPWPTVKFWRRMHLLNISDYSYAVALSEASALARGLVTFDPGWDEAPDLLRSHIRSWRFPAPVHEAIRLAVAVGSMPDVSGPVGRFVTDELTRADKHSKALSDARRDIARSTHEAALVTPHETPSGDPLQTPSGDVHETPSVTPSRDRARKPSKPRPRAMSDDELMPFIRDLLRDDPGASITKARKATGTGPDRARRLLERGQEEERQTRMAVVR